MTDLQTCPRTVTADDLALERAAEAEYALAEAARTIQLLQQQLRDAQALVLDLRGQLNRAARRD